MADGPTDALVFVADADVQRVSNTLSEFGMRPVAASGTDEFPNVPMRLAVIDPARVGEKLLDGLRTLQERLVRTPIVFLSGPCRREELSLLIGFPDTMAIVPREHVSSDFELRTAVRAAAEGPGFGWDGIIGGDGDQMSFDIAGSASRDDALDELQAFFKDNGVRRRIVALLVDAAEELITNAVYDAPVDLEGRPLYASLDRRHSVELRPEHHSTLRAATDGSKAAVMVRDPFGALRMRTVRRYISKGLRGGADQIDTKQGGAGLGLTRIYEMSDQVIIRIAPGKATEVIILIETAGGRRDMAARPTSLLLAQKR